MIRFGCCLPGGSFMPQGVKEVPETPLEILLAGYRQVMDTGYDFAECTAGLLTSLGEKELTKVVDLHQQGAFSIACCNSFVPASNPTAGSGRDLARLRVHVENVMARMQLVGAKVLVFGSGAARKCPEGYEMATALDENREFLLMCGDLGERYGVAMAVEPLNSSETNVIRTLAEGAEMVAACAHPRVKLLADAYHMARENEALAALEPVMPDILHIHVAEPPDRKVPGCEGGAFLSSFAKKVCALGYDGTVSVECGFRDFPIDCGDALTFLRTIFEREAD